MALANDLGASWRRRVPRVGRHAAATVVRTLVAAEADVLVDVVRSYPGHASSATTAIYNKAGARRRQREIAKLLG